MSSIYRKKYEYVLKASGNEYILVPITKNIAEMNAIYTLNETGTAIWEMIDGINSVDDIAHHLHEIYDVDYTKALEDVELFLKKMNALLEKI